MTLVNAAELKGWLAAHPESGHALVNAIVALQQAWDAGDDDAHEHWLSVSPLEPNDALALTESVAVLAEYALLLGQ